MLADNEAIAAIDLLVAERDCYKEALEKIMETTGRLSFYSIAMDALKRFEHV